MKTFDYESDKTPLGKEWKEYWRKIQSDPDLTKYAKRKIRKDKEELRRKIHRKLRRDMRKLLNEERLKRAS